MDHAARGSERFSAHRHVDVIIVEHQRQDLVSNVPAGPGRQECRFPAAPDLRRGLILDVVLASPLSASRSRRSQLLLLSESKYCGIDAVNNSILNQYYSIDGIIISILSL